MQVIIWVISRDSLEKYFIYLLNEKKNNADSFSFVDIGVQNRH